MVALKKLAKNGKTEATQIAAIALIFDRAYGHIPNVEIERIPSVMPYPEKLNGHGNGEDKAPISLELFRRTV